MCPDVQMGARLNLTEVILSGLMRWGKLEKLFWYPSLVVTGYGLLLIYVLTPWFPSGEAFNLADWPVRIVGAVVGLAGFLATSFLIFGMAIYCARHDRSRFSVKLSWFLFFFMAAPFGSLVYYFLVFRQDQRLREMPAQ